MGSFKRDRGADLSIANAYEAEGERETFTTALFYMCNLSGLSAGHWGKVYSFF